MGGSLRPKNLLTHFPLQTPPASEEMSVGFSDQR